MYPPGSPPPITPSSRRSRTRWRCCCSPSLREQPKSPRRRVVVQQLGVAAPLDDGGEQRLRRNEREVDRSEEHTSELQSLAYLVCRLLLEKKKIAAASACGTNTANS